MADYIYLLENRLSEAQKRALLKVREIARAKGLTVFLVGGAVRDLTSGSPVRDLDVTVQGNALKLKKDIEKAGAVVSGEMETMQTLYVQFPGGVRLELGSTLSVHYLKPGRPVVKAATILEDLRRRDFTANAMALSLNAGSYGLLMDPLNGVADIENRELRLVSNYGFIEDPVRMIRSQRFAARLGWTLEEKTQGRYETGKSEGYISAMQAVYRGYEAEELMHEEEPLRVMRRLEAEGWMKLLIPGWSSAKVNLAEMEKLREAQMQLQVQGVVADASAAQFPLLTAKMAPKDVTALKRSFPRKLFLSEIEALEGEGKKFAAELGSKQATTPSAAWKLLMSARPEVVLWVAYSTKISSLQAKFKSFYTEWPQARLKIPYALMQEMRIVPELGGYDELVEKLFFELMDGKLETEEAMKAFLEPYSPPAPPPPMHLRRARVSKKDAKAKKKAEEERDLEEENEGAVAVVKETDHEDEDADGEEASDEDDVKPAPVKRAAAVKKSAVAKEAAVKVAAKAAGAKPVVTPANVTVKAAAKKAAATAAAKKAPATKPVATKKVVAKVAKKAHVKAVKKLAAKKGAATKVVARKAPLKVARKAVAARKIVVAPKGEVAAKSAGKAGSKIAAKSSAKAASKKRR